MFLQIMHVGRIGHAANRVTDAPLVAPSAIRAAGQMWTDSLGLQDNDMPRALDTREIPDVMAEYAQATRNALAAGFDGVELHSASGYLPMQFLSTGSNHRTDAYGGTLQNRLRFVLETLEAMIAAAGSASRVGIKISPAMPFNDIQDDDPAETYTALARAISPMGLAYLHVMRSATLPNVFETLRPLFQGPFLAGGGFDLESGNAALAAGLADFIVFGKLFVSNPDLAGAIRQARGAGGSRPGNVLHSGTEGVHRLPGVRRLEGRKYIRMSQVVTRPSRRLAPPEAGQHNAATSEAEPYPPRVSRRSEAEPR